MAAHISRCQTVLRTSCGSAASSTPTLTFPFVCHVLKIRCFFDTNVFVEVHSAAISLPISLICRHTFTIARRICNIRLLAFVTINDGKIKIGFGWQFSHVLNRYPFVRRGNQPKHFAQCCDVLNSSTIKTTQLARFYQFSGTGTVNVLAY